MGRHTSLKIKIKMNSAAQPFKLLFFNRSLSRGPQKLHDMIYLINNSIASIFYFVFKWVVKKVKLYLKTISSKM